jgi:hypothetical protein
LMHNHLAIKLCAGGLVLVVLLAGTNARGNYLFTNVADTATAAPSGTFTGFREDPAISGGIVAFLGIYSGGSGQGVFTGNGGPTTTIAKTGDAAPFGAFTQFGLRGPSISGSTTVFHGKFSDGPSSGEGIFTGSGGPKTTIAKTGDGAPSGTFTSFDYPGIDDGTVAFDASYFGGEGIFVSGGGAPTAIVTSNGDSPSRLYTNIGSPAISGGTTAFFGVFSGTAGAGQGVFIDGGGPTIEIAKTGGSAGAGTFGGFGNPAISGGTAAFFANYHDGNSAGQGIFTGSGGAPTTIAKTGDAAASGTFSAFSSTPAISGNTTAFVGTNNGGSRGIYTGNGGSLTNVIKGGDPLFGSSVLDLSLGTFGLDSAGSGKLAFYYELTNGRRGVAIAAPSLDLAGDYNRDGAVGPEDYQVWRSSFGSTSSLDADGNGNNVIDAADYVVWRHHFGASHGLGTAVTSMHNSAPEPSMWILIICASWIAFSYHFKRSPRT